MDYRIRKLAAVGLGVLGLAACAPHDIYRTVFSKVCVSAVVAQPTPSPECETHALQQWPTNNDQQSNQNHYLLGFIEFDDQGQLWNRKQMSAVVQELEKRAQEQELLIVVFVHGWHHSAAPGDGNIFTLHKALAQLTDAEAQLAKDLGTPEREVAGVYLGWRGDSVAPEMLNWATFWDRKNTAQKVGHGGVTEVLSRLERIKQKTGDAGSRHSRTRLVVVGHSFGGLVVHSALTQILQSRFVESARATGAGSDVTGFADLVVLINPAFEALQISPLSDMATEQASYPRSQVPVLLEMTSEADWATRYFFRIGRWLSTFFEETRPDQTRRNAVTQKEESIDQSDANITAVGHFVPYRTHRLYPLDERGEVAMERSKLKLDVRDSVKLFKRTSTEWTDDKPGSTIEFGFVKLERTTTSAGRNPYLLAYVDRNLITGHNDIDDPRIIEFVKQLILISTQSPERAKAIRELKAP